MNPYDPYIEADWGDGTYRFRLGVAELAELENVCTGKSGERSGVMEIFQRIITRQWFTADIRETIRLGLIGGGIKPVDALRLARTYVDARPLMENYQHAVAILDRVLTLPEPLKKKAPKVKTEAQTEPST